LARKSHYGWILHCRWSLFFFSLEVQFLGFFMQP
jgi:hypothetical protein